MGSANRWRIETQTQGTCSRVTPDRVDVRHAIGDDADDINTIYNRYIVGSHVSFDTAPWTHERRSDWLNDRTTRGYPVLVASDTVGIVGAAWSGPWRDKEAYARSVETTIVLDPGSTGEGIGSQLYGELIEELTGRGFHRCYAIVALPNDASVALHEKLGFTDVGVLDEAGFKDGAYVSTLLLELKL